MYNIYILDLYMYMCRCHYYLCVWCIHTRCSSSTCWLKSWRERWHSSSLKKQERWWVWAHVLLRVKDSRFSTKKPLSRGSAPFIWLITSCHMTQVCFLADLVNSKVVASSSIVSVFDTFVTVTYEPNIPQVQTCSCRSVCTCRYS